MRRLVNVFAILIICLVFAGCGESSFSDGNSSQNPIPLPKADCGGDPCL